MKRVGIIMIGLLTLSWWTMDQKRTFAQRASKDEAGPVNGRISLISRERLHLEAETNLRLAEAQLKEAEERLRNAESQLARSKELYKVGEATQADVLQSERDATLARSQLDTAKIMLEKRMRELELHRKETAELEEDQLKTQRHLSALDAQLQESAAELDSKKKFLEIVQKKLEQAKTEKDLTKARAAQAELDEARASIERAYASLKLRQSQLQVMKDSTGKRVSVEFAEPTPGSLIINTLFSAANVSYVIDQSVRMPHISLKLIDVPFDKALNIVTEALGIQYVVKEGVFFIRPRTGQPDGKISQRTSGLVTIQPIASDDLVSVLEGSPSVALSDPSLTKVKPHSDQISESRTTFACPYCKKRETILSSDKAGGVRRYCPYCGKRVPQKSVKLERKIVELSPEMSVEELMDAKKAMAEAKDEIEELRIKEFPEIEKELAIKLPKVKREIDVELKKKLADDLPKIKKELDAELPKIKKQLADDLPRIKKELDAELPKIKKQLADDLPKIKKELDAEWPDIKKQLAIEMPKVQKELELELPKIKKQIQIELEKAQLADPEQPVIAKLQPMTKQATFICPHCKRKETITHTDGSAKGRWRYCPFCGKRVK